MQDESPSELVIQAWARLVRAAGQAMESVERDLKQAGFPPLAWYDVCLELRRAGEGGLRPLEIEQHLLIAQHNVSRLVARLEKANYVERHAHIQDGRGQQVVLTEAGHRLLADMWPVYRASIQRHIGKALGGDDKARQLLDLLEPLARRQP